MRDLKKNIFLMIMYTETSWKGGTCFINFNFCFCLVKSISKIGCKKYTSKVSIFYVSINYDPSCEDFLGLKYDESSPKIFHCNIIFLNFYLQMAPMTKGPNNCTLSLCGTMTAQKWSPMSCPSQPQMATPQGGKFLLP